MKRFGYDFNNDSQLDFEFVSLPYRQTQDADWVYNDGGTIKYIDDVPTGYKNIPPVRVLNSYVEIT